MDIKNRKRNYQERKVMITMTRQNLLKQNPINDEQLGKVNGGAIPIGPILKIVAPIILPPVIEQIQETLKKPKGNPAVPNTDLNPYVDKDAVPKKTYDTGEPVPNEDLNKYVEK
jgi:hypothetical protein